MSFNSVLAEDRRLIILRTLDQAPGYMLSDVTLKPVLDRYGHRVGRDVLRGDFTWLAEHGMVKIEKLDADGGTLTVWIVTMLELGQAVAQGRLYPGIARNPAS